MKEVIYLDTEFNNSNEENLNLVCVVTYKIGEEPKHWWTLNSEEVKSSLYRYIENNSHCIFKGWATVAEARSLYSLGFKDPTIFKWVDLSLEYKYISNHNDRIMYGTQLQNGRVKRTKRPPPKWNRTEEDDAAAFKQTYSLVEATFKLTEVIRDSEHKDRMRDIILSKDDTLILKHKQEILDYCAEDVIHLPKMEEKILAEVKVLNGKYFDTDLYLEEALWRGKYAALTSIRESRGYPINVEATRNLSNSILSILDDCQREINTLFPEVLPFHYSIKDNRFTWNQVGTREWISKNCDVKSWTKTENKALSLSLKAFEKFFPFKHSYPKDSFGAQMVRYLKLKQSLYGFVPSADKTKKTFWDSVGEDGWVRPYMGIYNSQSSRSQPSSTAFIPLKPAWMRALIQPPTGWAITALDYGSEEFFLSALLSNDDAMISAYLSGDPYFYFAMRVGEFPVGSKRDQDNLVWEATRELFKATCVVGNTLVRVKGFGYKEIKDITEKDFVWDGGEWKTCEGAIHRGVKEVTPFENLLITEDHLVLTQDDTWERVDGFIEEDCGGEICKKVPRRLQGPCFSWAEIWGVGCYLFRSYTRR